MSQYASLPYIAPTFHCKAQSPIVVSSWAGSTFRGALGYALKRVICPFKGKPCESCLLYDECWYIRIFETPVPKDSQIMRKYHTAPHPFVLDWNPEQPTQWQTGETFSLKIYLLGETGTMLPYFIYALECLGEMGLGKNKGQFTLEKVTVQDRAIYTKKTARLSKPTPMVCTYPIHPPPNHSPTETWEVHFMTPLRIRREGRLVRTLNFSVFFRNLLRRLSLLNYFYGDGAMVEAPFSDWIALSQQVKVEDANLTWVDHRRYSTRQKQRMALGGLVGRIRFCGPFALFKDFLKAGEKLHVGRTTSFGLGKYRLRHSS